MEKWKRNLYILWTTQIISMISFGLGLPFIPFFIQELGVVDPEEIKLFTGILSTAPAVTMAIMAPVWGALADRYGRKLMILRAMFAAVFVIGSMGFAQSVWFLVAMRGAQGLFTGTITAATAFIAANTPKERLSYALGFMSSSTFIGFSIGPMIGGFFAETYGYRFSFFVGGALMFVGFLLVYFLLEEDKSTIHSHHHKSKVKAKVKLFTPLIVSMLIMLFLHRLTRSIFSPYMPLYIQELLGGTDGAAKMTGIMNGFTGFATAIAGLTISRLGDTHNKMLIIKILLAISFLLSIALTFVNSLWGLIAIFTILFFFLGGIEPIITSTTAVNTAPELRGTLFGYQGLVGSIGWMVSPMIGAYISVSYGLKMILWVIPVCIIVNLLTSMVVSRKID